MRRVLVAGLPAVVALAIVGGAAFGYHRWSEAQEQERRAESRARREAERRQRREDEARDADRLGRASRDRMPRPLEGIALGETLSALRSRRPAITPSERGGDGYRWMEEELANRAQVLYAFVRDRLVQVQVLSRVTPEAVGPHLSAMKDRYGPPTGVWDCSAQSAAGVPTLRFLWREETVTVQDILLVHPGGVSLTLYIAPTEIIAQSLRLGSCRPVRDREQLAELPIATPEQLQERQIR